MKVNEILDDCCPESQSTEMVVEALYQGKTVKLNNPFRTPGGPKKFSVYVKNDAGNIVKVNFGDPNATIKNDDPKAAASFQARHKCSEKTDKTTPGYWSCNISRYPSAGLSSTRKW